MPFRAQWYQPVKRQWPECCACGARHDPLVVCNDGADDADDYRDLDQWADDPRRGEK